jgi:hypothetical protein
MKKQVYSNVPSSDDTVNEAIPMDEEAKEDSGAEVKKDDEFILDEIAWKKVKGDVFRRPKCSLLFSVLVGTGV